MSAFAPRTHVLPPVPKCRRSLRERTSLRGSESRHTFRADGPGRYKHFAVPVSIEKKSNSCRRDSNNHDDTVELVFVDVLAVEPAEVVAACEFVDVWADELPEPALTGSTSGRRLRARVLRAR